MPLLRLMRTVRHLRREQLVGQMKVRLRPLWERPARFAGRPIPDVPTCRWRLRDEFLPPGPQDNAASEITAGRLTFLNRQCEVGWPPCWQQPELPRLWQYNLHYFEYLWALDYHQAREVVLNWMAGHPLDRDNMGWDPYPTSLRLMNWCGVFLGQFRDHTQNDMQFLSRLWASIYLQAEWLRRHLETHLLANHLLENGAALAFVGSCFGGESARRWYAAGMEVLRAELPEQVLPDGMHFELSPMYHTRVAYVLALLANTGEAELIDLVEGPLRRMAGALACLCHPDESIALLGDSAFSIYNEPGDLITYLRRLIGEGSAGEATGAFALPDGGYYGWRGTDGSYVICDAGQIGVDYQPGHAHADVFSFELSLGGCRVVVDSGVSDYEASETRRYCRSTRAHNTVEIDGQDQCELWGVFRVARRGRTHDVRWSPTTEGFRLSGRHDGFSRLPGRPDHARVFCWHRSGVLTIRDTVVSRRVSTVVSRVHLHPECRVKPSGEASATVTRGAVACQVHFDGPGRLDVEDSYYCPRFGVRLANKALSYRAEGTRVVTALCIAPKGYSVTGDAAKGFTVDDRHLSW